MEGQPYKVELIEEHAGKGEKISFYRQGDFTDLCAGPHLTEHRHASKPSSSPPCTGAYWRGDANNKMLYPRLRHRLPQARLSWTSTWQLLEEAKKRDHRKLGKELGLFMLTDEGPGFPFFLPKGMVLQEHRCIDYWRQVHKTLRLCGDFHPHHPQPVLCGSAAATGITTRTTCTPPSSTGRTYAIKPMNCPGGMLVYKSEPHSYRDLPLRMGELGLVHRHELSGALHGLFRVRCFTQDDAHIFMTQEQMKDEIKGVVSLFDEVYSIFGLTYQIELSTMPEDHMGSEEDWEHVTEDTLKEAIDRDGQGLCHQRGRRRLLRPQAGLPSGGLPGPHLAVRHHPAGLPDARAV